VVTAYPPLAGPILRSGTAADGSEGDVLHDGLARQARGKSAAWAGFHPATLHLPTEEAALVLTGQWWRSNWGRDELRMDLAELAARAGIAWNARRAAHDRARYIQRWATPLNAVGELTGVRIEAAGGQVVIGPAAGEVG